MYNKYNWINAKKHDYFILVGYLYNVGNENFSMRIYNDMLCTIWCHFIVIICN